MTGDRRSPEFLAGQEFARTLPKLTDSQRARVVSLLTPPAPTPKGRRRRGEAVTS